MNKRIFAIFSMLYSSLLYVSSSTSVPLQQTTNNVVNVEKSSERFETQDFDAPVCEEEVPVLPSKQVEIPIGSRVLLAGDSLAVGMTKEFESIASAAGYEPHVHAIVGTNTRQWVTMLKEDFEDLSPSLVVVSLGTNDAVAYPTWLEKNSSMYRDLVTVADQAGVKIVWITPPPSTSKKIKSIKEVTSYIAATGVDYFDTSKIEIQKSDDQIHFTTSGYNKTITAAWLWMASRNIVASTSEN